MNTQLQKLTNVFVVQIVQPAIDFLFVVGTLVFVWGVVEFLWALSQDTDKAAGKRHMFWGLVGIFIMAGVLGILELIVSTICGGNVVSNCTLTTLQ